MKRVFSLALTASLATAVSASAFASTSTASVAKPAPKKWGVGVTVIGTSSLHSFDDNSYEAGVDYIVEPSYKITDELKVVGTFSMSQAVTGGDYSPSFNDPSLTVKHSGFKLLPGLKLLPKAVVQIPVTSGSRDNASLYSSVKGASKFVYDMGEVGASGLAAIYELAGTKSFHQYTQTKAGKPNTEFKLANTAGLSYDFLGMNLTALFSLTSAWQYSGASSTSFAMIQELWFPIYGDLGSVLGHSNGGNVTKTYGLESNIAFYDADASRVYGLLTYSF